MSHMRSVITAEVYERVSTIPMLAHYTSLEAFRSMLRSREFWFSRIRDTNDTSEAIEGGRIVSKALEKYGPETFQDYANLNALGQFEAQQQEIQKATYIFSLCEHGSDNRTDRLVMWQAYGHNGHGLCLVMRKDTLLGQKAEGRFPVGWCPIEYNDETQMSERVHRRLQQVRNVLESVPKGAPLAPDDLGKFVTRSLVQLVLSHKNPAFEHEREVRFVRSRLLQNLALPQGVEYRQVTISGQPRSKFVLHLREYPEFPIDASPPALLDHIIVGPSEHQERLCREVEALLIEHHLESVRIVRSKIPYRPKH